MIMKNKKWIGRFIILIGIVHLLVGFVLIGDVGLELLREGLFNTVNGQPMREAFFWFVFGGLTMIIIGKLTLWYEQQAIPFPAFLGWSLLGLSLLVVFIMPASGGWLMLIASVAILNKNGRQPAQHLSSHKST
jgi:membrane protease YdiL (CAAX protease family)